MTSNCGNSPVAFSSPWNGPERCVEASSSPSAEMPSERSNTPPSPGRWRRSRPAPAGDLRHRPSSPQPATRPAPSSENRKRKQSRANQGRPSRAREQARGTTADKGVRLKDLPRFASRGAIPSGIGPRRPHGGRPQRGSRGPTGRVPMRRKVPDLPHDGRGARIVDPGGARAVASVQHEALLTLGAIVEHYGRRSNDD